jgi:hypothetical protein
VRGEARLAIEATGDRHAAPDRVQVPAAGLYAERAP